MSVKHSLLLQIIAPNKVLVWAGYDEGGSRFIGYSIDDEANSISSPTGKIYRPVLPFTDGTDAELKVICWMGCPPQYFFALDEVTLREQDINGKTVHMELTRVSTGQTVAWSCKAEKNFVNYFEGDKFSFFTDDDLVGPPVRLRYELYLK